MKRSKRILSILSILFAVLLLAPVFALPASASAETFADETVRLVNVERGKKNLPALKTDIAGLHAAAKVRADESVVKFDIEAHKRPGGDVWYTVLAENGVTHFNGAGETLAAGYDTPAEVVAAWMDNEQDRANLLNPDFTHFGAGVFEGSFKLGDDPQNGYIVALLFITESKDRHPSADNAVQAFLRQINDFLAGYWEKGLAWILNWFSSLFPAI